MTTKLNNKSHAEQKSLTEIDDNKKQKFKLITERDIKKLEAYAKRVLPSEKANAGMFYARFRRRFLKTVEVLAKTSALLSEKEKNHVLTAETLKSLIKAFLTYDPDKNSESKLASNERAFMIAYLLAMEGENGGFDMLKSPYNTLLFDQPCRKKAMLLVMQLSRMKFSRPK